MCISPGKLASSWLVIHLPQGSYRGAAIFAHCFTCSKETLAATRIAAGLAEAGVAVLRFDLPVWAARKGLFLTPALRLIWKI